MSIELRAYMARKLAPDREALQSALDSSGYDLLIDQGYVLFQSGGYCPCTIFGSESGFEIYAGPALDRAVLPRALGKIVEPVEFAVTLRWGSNMSECACACYVAAVLVQNFGATVYYSADDEIYSAERLIEEAQRAWASYVGPSS